jgi:undecaprenyl pyrophosphate phosphatase UppP
MFAIGLMLRYLRTRSLTIFVIYRIVLAVIVVIAWLR